MAQRWFPRLYDAVMGVAERWRLGRWRQELLQPARGLILEIAAGTGLDFAHFAPGTTVIATEPDAGMLQRARARTRHANARVLLVAADAQALPFRDGVFDEAVSGLALCTIPSPATALAETWRVLKSEGTLRALEHVRLEQPVLGWLQHILTPVWSRIAGGCRLDERSVETVRRAGFRVDALRWRLGRYVVAVTASRPQDHARHGPGHDQSLISGGSSKCSRV